MTTVSKPPAALQDAFALPAGAPTGLGRMTVQFNLGCLVRNLGLIGGCLLGCLALALLVALVRTPTFTARVNILFDKRDLQIASQDAVFSTSTTTAPWVQTQAALLRSERILLQVVNNLKLYDDPEFRASRLGFSRVREGIAGDDSESGDQRNPDIKEAVRILGRRSSVTRVGETFLVELAVRTSQAEKSAMLANAITQVYMEEMAANAARVAEGASAWLRDRVRASGPTARAVTNPRAPFDPDPPGRALILLIGVVAGLVIGVGAALAKENLDPTVRTTERISSILGTQCVGVIAQRGAAPASPTAAAAASSGYGAGSDEKVPQAERVAVGEPGGGGGAAKLAALSCDDVECASAIDACATLLRFERRERIFGVTSLAQGDGKTMVAWNLARFIAATGCKVLVVDAAGGPAGSLSAQADATAAAGLTDLLHGRCEADDIPIVRLSETIDLLPVGRAAALSGMAIAGGRFAALLKASAKRYDAVIVDLPAITDGIVARAAAQHLQSVLFVGAWGRTNAQHLHATIALQDSVRSKLAAAVLNQVDMSAFSTYPGTANWFQGRPPGLWQVATALLCQRLEALMPARARIAGLIERLQPGAMRRSIGQLGAIMPGWARRLLPALHEFKLFR